MSEYDPLSQINKHVMLKNGMFELDDIPNAKCICGHSFSEHLIDLDGVADCCLVAKQEVCICDRFQNEDDKVIIPEKHGGKLQKKGEVLNHEESSYIHMLSKM